MRIRCSLSAAEMSRVCQRLNAQLVDRTADNNEFIAFHIAVRNIEITVRGSSEVLAAEVQREGRVSVPSAIFHGMMQTLPYFQERIIEIGFDDGKMCIEQMVFYHRMIVLSDPVSPSRSQHCAKHGSRARGAA